GSVRSATVNDGQDLPLSISSPDGTATLYTRPDDYTTVIETGEPNAWANPTQIFNGTRTTNVVDSFGLPLTSTTLDLHATAGGPVLSRRVYSYQDGSGHDLDPLHRSYDVTDTLAGLTTQYRYNCCSLDYVVEPDGTKTYHDYDLLKREIGTRRLLDIVSSSERVIQITNLLNGAGDILL